MINDVTNSGYQPAADVRGSAAPQSASSVRPTPAPQTTSAAPAEAVKAAADPSKLREAVSKLNDYVQNIQRTLSFSISEETGQTIIKVYDAETKELIRQIPPEQTIKLAEAIQTQTANVLLKEQA